VKVLLIQPDYPRTESSPQELEKKLLPSYSLILLAQLLEVQGHQAQVLDGFSSWHLTGKKNQNQLDQALKLLLEKNDYELVGISVYTPLRKEAIELAQMVKRISPESKIVLGGPHPSRLYASMLDEYAGLVDFILLGGADISLLELVENLEGKGTARYRIPGLAWIGEGGEIRANSRPIINLDLTQQSPVRFDTYLDFLGNPKLKRAYMITSRGCRFWCNFCSQLWKKLLLHPLERAVQEARHLIEELEVEELVIYDDCLGARSEHTQSFFSALSKFSRPARLIGISHFQLLKEDWLSAFKKAGGYGILLGLESGSSKLRRKMNKHLEDDEICQGVELVRKLGLKLGIYTMVGFPNESVQDTYSTYKILSKIQPEQVIAPVYEIKPGDMMIEFGLKARMIQESDYLDLDRRIINYMSEPELKQAVGLADYLETSFSPEPFLSDLYPSWWVLGWSEEQRGKAREKAQQELKKCQN